MKRKLKVILTLCLVSAISLSLFSVSSGNSSRNQQNKETNQLTALKYYKDIKDMFKNKYNKDNADYYAGSYIDDNGDLNVITTDDGKELKDLLKTDKVKFNKAKYSYNYLDNIVKTLNSKMIDLEISGMGIDEEKNKVLIYLKDLNDDKVNKIKKVMDCQAVEFINRDTTSTSKFTSTTEVINGKICSSKLSSTKIEKYTLGFAAKKSDGTVGFIIPGHVGSAVGTKVYYNNTTASGNDCGVISTKVLGGNCDASFVKRNKYTYPWEIFWKATNKLDSYGVYDDIYTNAFDNYIQGQYINFYGSTCGHQNGRILMASYSEVVSNISMTDMVKCDYMAIHGDSGGPVWFNFPAKNYLMGTQSFSGNLDANGLWVSGSSYSAFSKINNICSRLGVTTYKD